MTNSKLKNIALSSVIGLGTLCGGVAFAQDSSDNMQQQTRPYDGTTQDGTTKTGTGSGTTE